MAKSICKCNKRAPNSVVSILSCSINFFAKRLFIFFWWKKTQKNKFSSCQRPAKNFEKFRFFCTLLFLLLLHVLFLIYIRVLSFEGLFSNPWIVALHFLWDEPWIFLFLVGTFDVVNSDVSLTRLQLAFQLAFGWISPFHKFEKSQKILINEKRATSSFNLGLAIKLTSRSFTI